MSPEKPADSKRGNVPKRLLRRAERLWREHKRLAVALVAAAVLLLAGG
jgi:hypothetical protein